MIIVRFWDNVAAFSALLPPVPNPTINHSHLGLPPLPYCPGEASQLIVK